MRDIVVLAIVFGSLPFILRSPFIGVLMWTWLSLMNPHKLSWGIAVDFPLAQVVAVVLLASILITSEQKRIPWQTPTIILAIFVFWMFLTTLFSVNPAGAWGQWDKVWKVQLLTFITMMFVTSRERVQWMIWTIVVSLGLFGVKGGLFTVMTGGGYHVLGPKASFIAGNNEIGMALIMTLPLMRYLQLSSRQPWVRPTMTVAMGLTVFAILGTQSRGALLGLAAMTAYLWLKSRQRLGLLLVLAVLLPLAFAFMPESWHGRMDTIQSYEQDRSAQMRINAWTFAVRFALDHPIFGGGFLSFTPWLFNVYAPDPSLHTGPHSIYFQILGEQGFVGLGLFLALGVATYRLCGRMIRIGRADPSLRWAADLGSMLQVSLVGYAVPGAFLAMGYFDLYYALIAVAVAAYSLVIAAATARSGGEAPAPGEVDARVGASPLNGLGGLQGRPSSFEGSSGIAS